MGKGFPEAHPRFETGPGRQLQFDWKEDVVMRDRPGAECRFNVFSATLGHSRRHLSRRSPTRTRDDLLACMYDTAVRLGGVPAEWLTDNMSAIAAVGGDGGRSRDPRVERFAREAGLRIVLCAPRAPQAKGKVESANRFVSRLLAYEGDFDGWEGVDAAIARIERRSNEGPNGTTGAPPELLFMREKDALRPLGDRALLESMLGDVTYQEVPPPTMLVRRAGRELSVPRRMMGRRARLVLSADGVLRVYDGGDPVSVHDARAPGGPVVYDPAHYAEALEGKRRRGGDIEEAARRNLELLDALGGGGGE